MEDTTACQVYKLYLNPDVPVVIFDKTGFLHGCNGNILTERETQVVHDTINIDKVSNYRVVVYVQEKKKDQFVIEVYSERTHGFASVQVKKSMDKFYLLSKRYGILD